MKKIFTSKLTKGGGVFLPTKIEIDGNFLTYSQKINAFKSESRTIPISNIIDISMTNYLGGLYNNFEIKHFAGSIKILGFSIEDIKSIQEIWKRPISNETTNQNFERNVCEVLLSRGQSIVIPNRQFMASADRLPVIKDQSGKPFIFLNQKLEINLILRIPPIPEGWLYDESKIDHTFVLYAQNDNDPSLVIAFHRIGIVEVSLIYNEGSHKKIISPAREFLIKEEGNNLSIVLKDAEFYLRIDDILISKGYFSNSEYFQICSEIKAVDPFYFLSFENFTITGL